MLQKHAEKTGKADKTMKKKQIEQSQVEKHIGVLDGIRAISIVFVVWFHFWQQTWLTPYVTFDNSFTRYFGITSIELAKYVRYGFVFVDMLILLSAFCNFYPYARAIILGEKWPDTKEFYIKRAIRIIPSYLLSVFIVLFAVALPENLYDSTTFMWKDILTRLTFTSGLFKDTYKYSELNAVLWTVQMEVLYYILIPHLAKLFKRFPGFTYIGMMLISVISVNYIVYQFTGSEAYYVNHILTFAGVYANGMLFSVLYVIWKKYGKENKYTMLAFTVLSIGCIICFRNILFQYGGDTDLSVVQLKTRIGQSFLFSGFIFSTACAAGWYQKLFSNRLMRFVCTISYNLYIWHQIIAVKLKQYRIPYWEGEIPPNMTGDKVWQWKYQIIIIVVSVGVAILVTYGFEIPVAKFLRQKVAKSSKKVYNAE